MLNETGEVLMITLSMWKMLQTKSPSDFVISTGKSYTVRKFVGGSFKYVGIKIKWKGKGLKEIGYDKDSNKVLVKIDPTYYRPTDIFELRGDSSKAKKILKWKPKTSFKGLIKEMMEHDLKTVK